MIKLIMIYKPKDWIGLIYSILAVSAIVGGMGVWAGDLRWDQTKGLIELASEVKQIELNQLDREITFLQIKIDQGEASVSERIYIKTLQQRLRALKATKSN